VVVSRAAAHSSPLWRSQAAATPTVPSLASVPVMAAWSVFEEAAVKASATSDRPSSNRRLPRRDWQ
jgi:hypothetical protein